MYIYIYISFPHYVYVYIYITHVYNIYGDLPTGMHTQKEVWMEWWILEEMVAGGPTDELPTDLLSGHIFWVDSCLSFRYFNGIIFFCLPSIGFHISQILDISLIYRDSHRINSSLPWSFLFRKDRSDWTDHWAPCHWLPITVRRGLIYRLWGRLTVGASRDKGDMHVYIYIHLIWMC